MHQVHGFGVGGVDGEERGRHERQISVPRARLASVHHSPVEAQKRDGQNHEQRELRGVVRRRGQPTSDLVVESQTQGDQRPVR